MRSARSVLLLGASGVVGEALAGALGERVAGRTYLSRPIPGGVRFDVRSSSVSQLVSGLPIRPEAAVILLGETKIDLCAEHPKATASINVEGIQRVLADLTTLGIMPVFVSSDAVFDGSRSYWSEDDPPRPILTYGRQKLEVERFMASLAGPWIVVRLPKLLLLMIMDWVKQLDGGDSIPCATDQFFTPADPSEAAKTIVALIDQEARGLYHVAGPERLSRRALLQAVLEEYRLYREPASSIVDCSMREIEKAQKLREPRPLDTSMRSRRLASLEVPPMQAASAVVRALVRSHFAGHPKR
jgi:dTDP-4-dehydrorhamnose reductase